MRWNELAREARPRSVFVQHEWFAAAWAWRKAHFRLQMLVVRRGSQLLGVLPLVRRSDKVSRIVEYELLAVPDTQLADVLCVPANADEVVHALASTLSRDTRWDKLRLDFLPPEGVAVKSLAVALQRQDLGVVVQDCGRNFFVELSGTWERYYAGRSRRMKKAMKLAANRLHRTGDIHIEWLRPGAGDPERLAEALQADHRHLRQKLEARDRQFSRPAGPAGVHPQPLATCVPARLALYLAAPRRGNTGGDGIRAHVRRQHSRAARGFR